MNTRFDGSGKLALASLLGMAALALYSCNNDVTVFGNGTTATGGQAGQTTSSGSGGSTSSSGTGGTTSSASSGSTGGGGGGGGGGGDPCVDGPPNQDLDSDGFTIGGGDCDDCDEAVNPGAVEVPATAADDDCNGSLAGPQPCDQSFALDDVDPLHGAAAIELCQLTTPQADSHGLLAAAYMRADGTPFDPALQVGLADSFGPAVSPQAGSRILVLSNGHARVPGQNGACGSNGCDISSGNGTAPAGFPQPSPGCPDPSGIHDDVALEVELRTPTNAEGLAFDLFYYTFDHPDWACTTYVDQFVALVQPPPPGSVNGNVCFDGQNQDMPIGANSFMNVCNGCPDGTAQLAGTGFDTWGNGNAGATGWLRTTLPVDGGEVIQIRFAIWDSTDSIMDSTVLLDNVHWLTTAPLTVATAPAP